MSEKKEKRDEFVNNIFNIGLNFFIKDLKENYKRRNIKMVGLGNFTIIDMCKCKTKRRTFQPYLICSHNCPFCYSMLSGMRWNVLYKKYNVIPFIDFEQLDKDFLALKQFTEIEASSSCDPFDRTYEKEYRITDKALKKIFNQRDDILFTWVTKSALIQDYVKKLPKRSIPQITLESLNTHITSPNASTYNERLKAITKIVDYGFKVAVRIDPIIPQILPITDLEQILNDIIELGVNHITCSFIKLKEIHIQRVQDKLGVNLSEMMYLKNKKTKEYYVQEQIRLEYYKFIKNKIKGKKITFALCRENIVPDSRNASCDPFHLINPIKKITDFG